MKRGPYISVLMLGVLSICVQNSYGKYRMCVTERQATSDDCSILDRSDSEFTCVKVTDSADCALKMERDEADFGIFTAEEAILTLKFDTQQQLVVIAEIRESQRENEIFHFETVAIVKDDFPGNLQALRGKKFCHPGFIKPQFWSDRVLKHFERVVLNRTNSVGCNKSLTAVENELSALSSFFQSACRPGEWVADDYLDQEFKRQYSNLCQLCDQTNCSQNHTTDGHQYATLDCLTKRGGDVAYVAYFYVQEYFGLVNGNAHVDPGKYKYLCPDGTTQNISPGERPCKWIQQPWKSIIAKNTATGLKSKLETSLPTRTSRRTSDWAETLLNIILGNSKLNTKAHEIPLRSFIQQGREIPEPGTTLPCHEPVKWCTTSDIENHKCEWLRQAAVTEGIVPELQCVQGKSQLDCFKKIKNQEADIVGTNTNLGSMARHFSNLTTVMYQETEQSGHFKVVAVINPDLTAANLRELEGKKACFPEFAGLAWLAFVEAIRNSSELESRVCPYDDSMGNFFASVCAPGSKNQLLGFEDPDHSKDLCALCSEANSNSSNNNHVPLFGEENCAATIRNKFYGDAGALHCLASRVADAAFINAHNLSISLQAELLPQDFIQKYKIMCRDGTRIPLTVIPDDECALAVVTGGEMVARGSRSKVESTDLHLALFALDKWFGYTNSPFGNIFHLYKPFNNTEDLLFRRQTLGFLTLHEVDRDASTKTYADLKNNAEKCTHPKKISGAKGTEVGQTLLLLMLIISCLLF